MNNTRMLCGNRACALTRERPDLLQKVPLPSHYRHKVNQEDLNSHKREPKRREEKRRGVSGRVAREESEGR